MIIPGDIGILVTKLLPQEDGLIRQAAIDELRAIVSFINHALGDRVNPDLREKVDQMTFVRRNKDGTHYAYKFDKIEQTAIVNFIEALFDGWVAPEEHQRQIKDLQDVIDNMMQGITELTEKKERIWQKLIETETKVDEVTKTERERIFNELRDMSFHYKHIGKQRIDNFIKHMSEPG